jgi:hypothetical protein
MLAKSQATQRQSKSGKNTSHNLSDISPNNLQAWK